MTTTASVPDVSPERGVVNTRAGAIHYEVQGRGPTLFAVHGLPGTSRDFRRFGASLAARGVRVVAFDAPGFGDSPALAGESSWSSLAEALDDACSALANGPFAIAAHSFGAHLAIRMAARNPRVQALVLLAPAGLRPHRALRRLGRPMCLRVWRTTPSGRAIFYRGLLKSGVGRGVSRATSDLTLALLGTPDFGTIAAALRSLAIPVLTARCDDDPFIEPQIVEELTRAARDGIPYHFSEGAHAPQKMHGGVLAEATATLLLARLD